MLSDLSGGVQWDGVGGKGCRTPSGCAGRRARSEFRFHRSAGFRGRDSGRACKSSEDHPSKSSCRRDAPRFLCRLGLGLHLPLLRRHAHPLVSRSRVQLRVPRAHQLQAKRVPLLRSRRLYPLDLAQRSRLHHRMKKTLPPELELLSCGTSRIVRVARPPSVNRRRIATLASPTPRSSISCRLNVALSSVKQVGARRSRWRQPARSAEAPSLPPPERRRRDSAASTRRASGVAAPTDRSRMSA